MKLTIRMQLSALVLAVVIPLLLLIAFNIVGARDNTRTQALADTLAIAHVISARIDDHIQNINTLLTSVSVLIDADLAAVDANDARLRALQAGLPSHFNSISVLAPDGRQINSSTVSRREREKLNFADRDYFQQVMAQRSLVLGEPIISRVWGNWISVAARPLLAADGTIRAVIAVSTLLESIQHLLPPTGLPEGSVMTVLNEQGIVLARSVDAQKWVGANLSVSPNFRRTQVEREFVNETVASDGVTRLAGYTTARAVPWIVYVGIPSDIGLEKMRTGLLLHSILALFVVIAAVMLAYLLARRITRPIEAITGITQQIEAGSPDARIKPAGPVEIVEISTRFNHMLDEMAKAQKSLRKNEAQLRSIFDGLGPQMFVGLMTPDGVLLEANRPVLAAAGLKREDVLGKPVEQTYWFAYSETVQRQLRSAIEAAAAGTPCRYDVEIRVNDTQRLWIDFSLYPLRDASGQVTFLVPSALVIAERRQAEAQVRELLTREQRAGAALLNLLEDQKRSAEMLQESEGKLRLFIDYAPSAIAMFDREMRYVAFSRRWLTDYNLVDQDITGRSHYEIFPDLPERWKEIHRKCMAGAIEKAEEDPFPRSDGAVDWVRWEIHPWHVREGSIGGIIIFSEIVTGRKQAEIALRENNLRLREISHRLFNTEETERRKINRELHDRIGQNLSALNLILRMIGSRLPAEASQELVARFDDAQELIEATTQQVRDVMADLRPAALNEYGLFAALRAYAEPWARRTGIPLAVTGEDLAPRLPPATEIALFRIAQEALTNTAKHAQAHHVNVALTATPHSVSLSIADNGVGFNPEEITRNRLHWGTATMSERAAAIGATLRVESAPGKGTRVVVEVPRQET